MERDRKVRGNIVKMINFKCKNTGDGNMKNVKYLLILLVCMGISGLLVNCPSKQVLPITVQDAGPGSRMFSGLHLANIDYGFTYTENAVVTPNDSVSTRIIVEWPATRVFLFSDGAIYFNWALTDTSTDAIDSLASLQLPASTMIVLIVPWGLTTSNDDILYLHLRNVAASDSSIVRNATG